MKKFVVTLQFDRVQKILVEAEDSASAREIVCDGEFEDHQIIFCEDDYVDITGVVEADDEDIATAEQQKKLET